MLNVRWNGAEHEKATGLKPTVDFLNHFSDLSLRHSEEEGEVRSYGVVRGGLSSEVAEVGLPKRSKRDLFSCDVDHDGGRDRCIQLSVVSVRLRWCV
jgi:hypothetical protein